MKRIIFAYPAMMLGGSTTSLLSILYNLDYEKYSVDLLLDRNTGEWLSDIPKEVHLLKPSYLYPDAKQRIIHQIFSPRYMLAKFKAKQIQKQTGSYQRGQQYLEMKDVDFYRDIDEEYDVAIAFLEGQQCKYVANHICAKRKIAWIHVDYKASQFCYEYDIDSMKRFDKIVTVSEECLKSYCEMFPELASKCVCVENILSQNRIEILSERDKASITPDATKINFVTTCRISFKSKGLDRAVRALVRVRDDRITDFEKLRWYIVGDGDDRSALQKQIDDVGLSEQIFLLGMKTNPYPYLKNMDLFFLPSIWEGKPMAVTEAQILGLPALVTHYASAYEQVQDGIDGMVVENSEDGVYNGIKAVLENQTNLSVWKENVEKNNYSNVEEIQKVEDIIDGID